MVTSLRLLRPARALLLVAAMTAAVVVSLGLAPRVAQLGSGPDATLTVRAKGSAGGEVMEVRVAGTVIASFTVGTEWRDYRVETPSSAGAPNVEVWFVSDTVEPIDHNLWIDWVSFGGRTYQAEAPTTFSTGVWQNGAECRPGYHRSEALACNGKLSFGDLPGPEAERAEGVEGGTLLAVTAAGNVGAELVELLVDGEAVATFQLGASPDLVRDPRFATYRFRHAGEVSVDRVGVAFVNDLYRPGVDHNVRVASVAVGDATYEIDSWDLELAEGVDVARCLPAWESHRLIVCNGQLGPAVATETTPADDRPGASPEDVNVDDPGPGSTPVGPSTPGRAPGADDASTAPSEVGDPADPTSPPEVGGPAGGTADPVVDPGPTEPASPSPSSDSGPVGPGPGGTPSDENPIVVPPNGPVPVEPVAPPPEPPKPSPATGRFYVVGKDIVGPDGNVFYPIGANVAIKFTPYGYVFEGGNGGVNDHLDDVKIWNWNTIRATLVCDNTTGVPSFDELVNGIHPTIERFTAAGIVVILECHDLTGSDPALGSPGDLRLRPFWDEMVERYGDNPYVWFNLFNEPYASRDTENWRRLHEFHVDRIRRAGAENIIIADLPVWGQGIDLVTDRSFADGLNQRCNTVFGWHAYGALAGRQGTKADHERYIQRAHAKDIALIVGEYGVALPAQWGNAGPWAWNVSGFEAMNLLGPKYGIGLLWWHATGDTAFYSLYALKWDRSAFWSSRNEGNLTQFGRKFWATSQRVSHSAGPFEGDITDSGCPSLAS